MKNIRIVFIHGNDSLRWSYAWTPWLKQELKNLNLETIFETFPDSIEARKEYWMPFLEDYIKPDENTLLIGHSSGAIAAMRYAENHKIFGSILIAPYHTDLGLDYEKASGWFDEQWNWDNIKNNQKTISIFYSKNDPAIPQKEFNYVKQKLSPNKTYQFENKGHFINQTEFSELLEHIKEILK